MLGGYQIPSGTKVVSAGMVISNDGDHFDVDVDVDDDVDVDEEDVDEPIFPFSQHPYIQSGSDVSLLWNKGQTYYESWIKLCFSNTSDSVRYHRHQVKHSESEFLM